MDNTWATPLYYRPFDHGVDLVIQAGTKYIGGHSDVMLGTVSANAPLLRILMNTVRLSGLCEGPDDVYLGLRGLRTLSVRLERHSNPASPSGAGSSSGRKFCACCIRPWKAIRATRCGSAISPAPRDCSAWCSSRCRRRRSMPSSTRWNCSASALPGAAMKPRHPVRLFAGAHGHALAAWRSDGTFPHRARSGRGFDCRS